MLEKEVGFTGKFILERQCQALNKDIENISYVDLEPLANNVKQAIKHYTGEKRAEEIRKGMLEYQMAMDVVEKASATNFENLKNFAFLHLVEADITIARKKLDLGLNSECIDALKKARDLLENTDRSEANALESRISRLMGRALSTSSETFDRAVIEFQRAISSGTVSDDHYNVALSWRGIGSLSWRIGRYSDSLEHYNKGLAALESMPDSSKEERNRKMLAQGLIKSGIGRTYMDLLEYEKAIEYDQEAIDIFEALDNFAEAGRAYSNLGLVYEKVGNCPMAVGGYQQAISFCVNSGSLLNQGWAMVNLANLLIDCGRAEEARPHLEKAEQILGNFSDPLAYSKLNCTWGKYHREKGQWSDGIQRFQRSIDVVKNAKAPDYLANAKEGLGFLYLKKGDGKNATENFQQALEWFNEKNDLEHVYKLRDLVDRSSGFTSGLL